MPVFLFLSIQYRIQLLHKGIMIAFEQVFAWNLDDLIGGGDNPAGVCAALEEEDVVKGDFKAAFGQSGFEVVFV